MKLTYFTLQQALVDNAGYRLFTHFDALIRRVYDEDVH